MSKWSCGVRVAAFLSGHVAYFCAVISVSKNLRLTISNFEMLLSHGVVAQSVARLIRIHQVRGSKPLDSIFF